MSDGLTRGGVETPKMLSTDILKTGDQIRIGKLLYAVTGVVPPSAGWGRVVELQRSSGPKTTYTLMPHEKKAGSFLLTSVARVREITTWTVVLPKKAKRT